MEECDIGDVTIVSKLLTEIDVALDTSNKDTLRSLFYAHLLLSRYTLDKKFRRSLTATICACKVYYGILENEDCVNLHADDQISKKATQNWSERLGDKKYFHEKTIG